MISFKAGTTTSTIAYLPFGWTSRSFLRILLLGVIVLLWQRSGANAIASPVNSTKNGRENYAELINHLLTTADPSIPPNAANLSQPVSVSITTRVDQLKSLDARKQVLTVYMVLYLRWYDRALSWSKEDFPVDVVYLDPDTILWRPEIVAHNILDAIDAFVKLRLPIKVKHDGLVRWHCGEMQRLTCPLNTRLFPFDRQECNLILAPWLQNGIDVNVTLGRILPVFHDHPEWTVLEVKQRHVLDQEIY